MLSRLMNTAALVMGLAILAPMAFSAPAAALDETAFDFGYVPQNAKISHVFQIKSVGDDTLKIVQVIPGCGCTKAPLEKSDLASGESTRLEVVFSTGQYQGRIVKHPSFVTNEANAQHKLEFLSNVITRPDSTYPVIIRPATLDFSSAGGVSPQTMTVRITNVSDADISIELIDLPEHVLQVTLPGKIPAGGSADATIQLIDVGKLAEFEKSFTIQLDDPQTSRFTVPVKKNQPGVNQASAPAPGR